jgi:hypothetical protein
MKLFSCSLIENEMYSFEHISEYIQRPCIYAVETVEFTSDFLLQVQHIYLLVQFLVTFSAPQKYLDLLALDSHILSKTLELK